MTQLLVASSFERDRKRLPDQVKQEIDQAIDWLIDSRFDLLDVKRLKHPARLYRIRVNDFRIVLKKKASNVFILLRIGHRKDIYRTL